MKSCFKINAEIKTEIIERITFMGRDMIIIEEINLNEPLKIDFHDFGLYGFEQDNSDL